MKLSVLPAILRFEAAVDSLPVTSAPLALDAFDVDQLLKTDRNKKRRFGRQMLMRPTLGSVEDQIAGSVKCPRRCCNENGLAPKTEMGEHTGDIYADIWAQSEQANKSNNGYNDDTNVQLSQQKFVETIRDLRVTKQENAE